MAQWINVVMTSESNSYLIVLSNDSVCGPCFQQAGWTLKKSHLPTAKSKQDFTAAPIWLPNLKSVLLKTKKGNGWFKICCQVSQINSDWLTKVTWSKDYHLCFHFNWRFLGLAKLQYPSSSALIKRNLSSDIRAESPSSHWHTLMLPSVKFVVVIWQIVLELLVISI